MHRDSKSTPKRSLPRNFSTVKSMEKQITRNKVDKQIVNPTKTEKVAASDQRKLVGAGDEGRSENSDRKTRNKIEDCKNTKDSVLTHGNGRPDPRMATRKSTHQLSSKREGMRGDGQPQYSRTKREHSFTRELKSNISNTHKADKLIPYEIEKQSKRNSSSGKKKEKETIDAKSSSRRKSTGDHSKRIEERVRPLVVIEANALEQATDSTVVMSPTKSQCSDYNEDFEECDSDFEDVHQATPSPTPQRLAHTDLQAKPLTCTDTPKEVLKTQETCGTFTFVTSGWNTDQGAESLHSSKPRLTDGSNHCTVIDFTRSLMKMRNTMGANLQRRAAELQRFIELEFTVCATLFDLKPMDEYSGYMVRFGRSNQVQALVQTQDDMLGREIQTDEVSMCVGGGKWTQWPALDNGECCGAGFTDGGECWSDPT